MSNVDDKLNKLTEENNARVKKVEELSQQIEACKQAIAQLKEEHDFTRGQIVLMNEIKSEENTSSTKAKTKDTK